MAAFQPVSARAQEQPVGSAPLSGVQYVSMTRETWRSNCKDEVASVVSGHKADDRDIAPVPASF